MEFFFSLLPKCPEVLLIVLKLLCFVSIGLSFTVIMSDSGAPSALVDGPQSGFSINKIGARTDTHEQEAVYDVMKATGNNWATDIPDVCRGRWHGIECMPDKDNVYHVVSLSFGALSDDTAFPTCDPTKSTYISPSITKLPHIRTLFFYRCFSYNPQPIPSFIGQLGSTLQTLVLRENGHVGPIPSELGDLTHLKVLDLHKNNLNGSIPISLSRVIGLRSLDLSGNKLTGSIPNLTFPNLNIMNFNENLLMGPIPSSIGTCHSLIKIDFSHNRLTGPIPDSLAILKELTFMDLSYNRISGPFPVPLGGLSSLQALLLKGNPTFSPTIPSDAFDGMKSLRTLILSNMNLQGPIPMSLGELPNLRVLHLDGNHLNGSIPLNFRDMKNLNELRLNDNELSGPIPFGREMVWRMKRKLRLCNNHELCYNPNSGFENGLHLSYNSGIGLCDNQRFGSTRIVEHLSNVETDMFKIISASTGIVPKTSVLVWLLHLITFVWFFSMLL